MQGAYYSSDIFVIFTIVITIFNFLVPNIVPINNNNNNRFIDH